MPSKSKKQHNFMEAVAHSEKFAKKVGVPMSVGKDFSEADKGRKFGTGGGVGITRGGQKQINKQVTRFGSVLGNEKNVPNINLNKYTGKKEGGMATMKHEDIKLDKKIVKKAVGMHDKQLHGGKKTNLSALKAGGRIAAKGEHSVQKQSKRGAEMVKMAKGGLASGHKAADGIAVRGKTKAMDVKMCGGGKAMKK
jgi:hypothetical protein